MGLVRSAAVSGLFYPADPAVLARDLRQFLDAVVLDDDRRAPPKALIAPHAGYVYSGPIAASAYARLRQARQTVSRVVLFGPSHRIAFTGLAIPSAEAFETPLGPVPLDRAALETLERLPGVFRLDAAHGQEHSLEVHLPFLQMVLDRFTLVPVVVGNAQPSLVADALEAVWGGEETLVVISSDLSHYQSYEAARQRDRETCRAIERLDPDVIDYDSACGRLPIAGLLAAAKRHGLTVETTDLRNSGDTVGPRDKVVGYGAWIFRPLAGTGGKASANGDEALLRHHGPTMLDLARRSIAARLRGRPSPTPGHPLPEPLRSPGACFVTLRKDGNLRGCIGSAAAWRPLAEDIVDNAEKAAFQDPRFQPLRAEEWDDIDVSLSILTPPHPMAFADEADLLEQLRPGIDGLIIEDGEHRALFLPSVWEQLPAPVDFLAHLKRKAGLGTGHWSPTFSAQRFRAIEIEEEG